MIKTICINNYALIDRTEITLGKGFSVITGETGAGKSILLGAIGLTIGQRADSSIIMDKSKKCVVEIEYDIRNYPLEGWFVENDLDYSSEVFVRREVSHDGKSRCFINDTPVSNKLLKDFGGFMVDIHSQHQSLLLSQPEYQTDILDTFCGNGKLLVEYREFFLNYRRLDTQLKELKQKALDAEKEGDYIKFRFAQLESAHLKVSEQEELERELELLTNAESIKSALGAITWGVRDADPSVVGILKQLKHRISSVENSLRKAGEYHQRLESVMIELNDLADEAERTAEHVEYDAARIESIHQRLNVVYDLLYKYKVETVTDLIVLQDSLKNQLKLMEGGSEKIDFLEKQLQQTEKRMKELAERIRKSRCEGEARLCEEMKRLLVGLGIRHAEFVVGLQPLDHFTNTGCDDVRFLFCANKNQQPGEIAKVASGGEISRVMLALKYVLSGSKQLPVVVFDEIDTGLSGEVAHRMAQIMREMSERMQVISISHLPQIAAAGNSHFKVYKEDSTEATISRICQLNHKERVREIAGMISGKEITPVALEAAENLLQVKIEN